MLNKRMGKLLVVMFVVLLAACTNENADPVYPAQPQSSDTQEVSANVVEEEIPSSLRLVEILPPTYGEIEPFYYSRAIVWLEHDFLAGFIDTEGNEVVPPSYYIARPFSEGLAVVAVYEQEYILWGFIDIYGNEIVPPMYTSMDSFAYGRARVSVGEWSVRQFGFLDTEGNEIIPPIYRSVGNFFESLAVANGVWGIASRGVIDIYGNEVLTLAPGEWTNIEPLSEGLFAVQANAMWGVIDMDANVIVSPRYSSIQPFSDGLARVENPDWSTSFIDTEGNEVIQLSKASYWAMPFSEGFARIGEGRLPEPILWGFIDTEGNEIVPPIYRAIRNFSEGFAAVAANRYGWGFIDTAGNEVVLPRYGRVMDFSEGLAAVSLTDGWPYYLWGFVDTEGNEVIPPTYDWVWPFSGGLAIVAREGLWGAIDAAGDVVIPLEFPASDLEYIGEGLFAFERGNLWGIAAVAQR